MTDNIFEIDTTAVVHVACAPRASSILLTDFAAAYLSVNHSWVLHALEKTELLELNAVSNEGSTTAAPHASNSQ